MAAATIEGLSDFVTDAILVRAVVDGISVSGTGPAIREEHSNPENEKDRAPKVTIIYKGTAPWPFAYTSPGAVHPTPEMEVDGTGRKIDSARVPMMIQTNINDGDSTTDKGLRTYVVFSGGLFLAANVNAKGPVILYGTKPKERHIVWRNARAATEQHLRRAVSPRG